MNLPELFWSHKSIRSYKPDPIPQDLIDRVLADAVAGASSSGNLNSVSLVLTRDPERKKVLYGYHSEQPMILEAPLLITFCADWCRTRDWLELREARDNFNNFLGYHVAAYDAMIIAQNACLGFENEGLGICYMGTTLFSLRKISEFLELPPSCAPVTTVVVGYPNEAPSKRDRLPVHSMVFDEVYRRHTKEQIEEIYREREVKGWERYMSMPGLTKLAEEHGITSLAQFYTSKVKYDPDYFAECSKEIKAYLVDQDLLQR